MSSPRIPLVLLLAGLLVTSISGDSGFASNEQLPRVFQSGDNDVIRIHQGALPSSASVARTHSFLKNITKSRRKSELKNRLVIVCLQNSTDSKNKKAFDVQNERIPRYVASFGQQSCTVLEPTRHTFYFWKATTIGNLKLILSNRLDLTRLSGTQITLNWILD